MSYVKDIEKTQTDIKSYEEAMGIAHHLKVEMNDPKELTYRIRVRRRNRTGMWDVVVKVKREQKA